MKKSLWILAILMLAAAAQPLWGGTVYIDQALNRTVKGTEYVTQVRVYNDGPSGATFTYLFIPANVDGTTFDRETEAIEVLVPPRTTRVFEDLVPDGKRGMLEIAADDAITVTARVIGTRGDGTKTFGAEMPVVTSRRAISAGNTAVVQGVTRTDGRIETDFYVLNLSINNAVCAIEAFKRGGTRVLEQTVVIKPLTLSFFKDVVSLMGLTNATDLSLAVTCDQLAHAYALTQDIETGELLHIMPAGGGTSTLDPFPSNDCPEDALLNLPGVYHIPSRSKERATFLAPTTPGESYERFLLTMEFTVGRWHAIAGNGHNIVWGQRTTKWTGNLFVYLNYFAGNKNRLKNVTNADLPRGVVQSIQQGTALEEGETYVVNYTYDAAGGFSETVLLRKGGGEIVRMVDSTTVNRIVTAESFQLAFGHTSFEHGPEVPTYGWRYANLCVQLK